MGNSDRNINDEILDRMVIQVDELNRRLANLPDYKVNFEILSKNFDNFLQQYRTSNEDLKNSISQRTGNNNLEQIQTMLAETKRTLESVTKILAGTPKHSAYHTKIKAISGVIIFIVIAVSTWFSGRLWKENNRLEVVDIKYKIAKQLATKATRWIDSIYLQDPREAKRILAKMEAGNSITSNYEKSHLNHRSKMGRKNNK